MEKAKVRSVLPTATERIMSIIVSRVRNHIRNLDIEKSIRRLMKMDYPEKDAIRLSFMSIWNGRNNKRLLTLPLFIHTIYYIRYGEGSVVDVYSTKYVSTNKITQKQFGNIEKNKQCRHTQMSLNELLENKKLFKIGKIRLSYCLFNTYNYKKNEIIEIKTEQIL